MSQIKRDRLAIFLLGAVTDRLLHEASADPDPIHSIGFLIGFVCCAFAAVLLIFE